MRPAHARSEPGFTLVELLIAMLVLAILATTVLPAFARHKDRGDDAVARSGAAEVAAQMEQCEVQTSDFGACDTEAKLDAALGSHPGTTIGNGVGEVQVQQVTVDAFRLRARSRSGAAYILTRPAEGPVERSCTPPGQHGCPASGAW